MNLTRLAVKRPVGVTALAVALTLFGTIALVGLGLDFLPHVQFPVVAVVTVYPGADAPTIESDVTAPLEDTLSSIAGVRQIRSTSIENASMIVVELDWDANIDAALRQMETQLTIAHHFLPDQVEKPIIIETDPDQLPLLRLAVGAKHGEAMTETDITRRLETDVVHRLKQIPGVAAVQLLGATREEIVVEYDSDSLAQHKITPLLLGQILSTQNVIVPAGTVEEDGRRLSIRAGNIYKTIDDVRNQTVSIEQPEGPGVGLLGLATAMPVRLRDVADVHMQPIPRDGLTRINGAPAVILQITKKSGANTSQVSKLVEEQLAQMEQSPQFDLSFHTVTAQTDLIGASLSNVSTSALIGSILAVSVLFLFLRQISAIVVIGLAIPLSVVMTLIGLYFSGLTLNMMSLGGLALSVGMLVDNAIVVIENIYRRRSLGEDAITSAAEGGAQIGPAILAATLTTVAVFLPLLFLKSLVGILFRETALSVAISLVASLVVSLTVIPMAAARFKSSSTSPAPNTPKQDKGAKAPSAGLQRVYTGLLRRWTATPWPTIVLLPLLAWTTAALPAQLDQAFLPNTDGGLVMATFTLPSRVTSATTADMAQLLEQAIMDMPEVDTVLTLAGDQGEDDLLERAISIGHNEIHMTIVLRPKNERTASADDVARRIQSLPEAQHVAVRVQSDRTTEALGDDFFPGLTLQILGPDYATLQRLHDDIVDMLSQDDRFDRPYSDLKADAPRLLFRVTERSFQGVRTGGEPMTAGMVGVALRNHLTGGTATHVNLDGITYPVTLRAQTNETDTVEALEQFRVPGSAVVIGGSSSPLIMHRIAEMQEETGLVSIQRVDRTRAVHVRAPLKSISLTQAASAAQRMIDTLDIPPNYEVRVSGIHDVINESVSEVVWVLAAAALLVYVVMAVQFESFSQPLLIMLTVPLAATGAFSALKFTGHALGVPAFIGLLILIGVSVNHGIIMVDFINEQRRQGVSRSESVIVGAATRLRPILMTTVTTVLGLVPLAVAWGEGSEMLAPLAVAVIGGLLSSTVLTLFVIPGIMLMRRDRF